MPSDYQKQIKEIFGTSDLDELRELAKMLKINHPNPRNAGRKAQLTPDQIVEGLELHRKGIGNTEIAKQFGVSRQTIYKYIYSAEHFSTDPDFTMRMNFMYSPTVAYSPWPPMSIGGGSGSTRSGRGVSFPSEARS